MQGPGANFRIRRDVQIWRGGGKCLLFVILCCSRERRRQRLQELEGVYMIAAATMSRTGCWILGGGRGAGQCARISGWRDIQIRRGRRNEGLDPPSFVMACSFFTRYLERAVEKGLLRLSLRRNLLRAEIDFLHLPLVVVVCKMKLDE
jgi:hypothetical protein